MNAVPLATSAPLLAQTLVRLVAHLLADHPQRDAPDEIWFAFHDALERSRDIWLLRATLKNHLLPTFGDYYMDQIRRGDVMKYRDALARQVTAGEASPRSAESLLKVLKLILRTWVQEHDAEHDPTTRIKLFDNSLRRVYTRENPNALTPSEVQPFLATVLEMAPRYFALVALGLFTGLRTCSLRPLRRKGPNCDILWDEGVLLNRRSNTVGQIIMERTKIGLDQDLPLPADLIAILRWHVERLPPGPMADSDLLFPRQDGQIEDRRGLSRLFNKVAKKLGLNKRITPHGMRRTNKDLLRATGASQVVSMAISGHMTTNMHQHYSTVSAAERRVSISKAATLVGVAALLPK